MERRKERVCIECGREAEELGVCFRCIDCCRREIYRCWRFAQCGVGKKVLFELTRKMKVLDEDDGYAD